MENKAGDKKIFGKTILLFLAAFSLCFAVGAATVYNRMNAEMLTMENLIVEKSTRIGNVISRLFYKTEVLSALVIQGNGDIENFERIASVIIDDPAILNVLIAPGGVVSKVYPFEKNEVVVGLDFFDADEWAGNKEAIAARDTGMLVLGGPFVSAQGVPALVGRMPVYLPEPDGNERFWGLISVTLRYPEALDGAGLDDVHLHDFGYEIWRINPDDGKKQIIAGSGYTAGGNTRYMEKHIAIHNADWYFRIYPLRSWYEYFETWITLFGGLCISFLIAFIAQSNTRLKRLRYDLKSLTGTLNKMAVKFLAQSDRPFNELITEEGRIFADVVDIDRFSVWRNFQAADGLHTGQIYRWHKDTGGIAEPLAGLADIPYSRISPRWERILSGEESVNGPARLLPEAESFAPYGTKSAFISLVFIGGNFWGFVLYEDHRKERFFNDDHAKFMRSAAFLFANAVMHYELKQEMLVSHEKTKALAHWYKSILDAIPLPISVTDVNMKWTFVNTALEIFLDMERENLYGKHCSYWGTVICNTSNCGIACAKRGLKRTYFNHSGKSYQVDADVLNGINDEPIGFIEVVQDITQVKEMALKIDESTEQIKHLENEAEKIYYCPLTGIYNRRYFDEYLTRLIQTLSRSGGNLSLMMVDVDYFKRYNDTYGHSMGDECLKTVAEVLSQSVTRGDDFVARYGGEEFAVVLPNTDENGARMIAEKLLENIRERNIPHEKSDAAACVTVSIGVTTGNVERAQTAHDYIKQADKMLYESKWEGRNRYTLELL